MAVAWVPLWVPFSVGDRSEDLITALRTLRVPAWVRYRRIDGSGTMALVPIDHQGEVLSISSGYGPTVDWVRVDAEHARASLASVGLRDLVLGDDEEWPESAGVAGGNTRDSSAPDDRALARSEDEVGDALSTRVDAAAWDGAGVEESIWPVLARRFHVALGIVEHGSSAVVVPDDPTAAIDSGVWASTNGIAMWRSGDELAVVMVRGKKVHQLLWTRDDTAVEPQRPGQTLTDGSPILIPRGDLPSENDAVPWIARFDLSEASASHLRAVLRSERTADTIAQLVEILGAGHLVARVVTGGADWDELTVRPIAPARLSQAVLTAVDAEILPRLRRHRSGRFRLRHPALVLIVALFLCAGLLTYGILGIAHGRLTALLPLIGVVAMGAEAIVAVYILFARRRGVLDEPPVQGLSPPTPPLDSTP